MRPYLVRDAPRATRAQGGIDATTDETTMNMLKTTMLLAALTALFGALGYTLGGAGGALIALGIAVAMNVFTYWNADKIVLKMHDAREVGPDHPLHRMVARLAQRGAMPMPRVYVVESPHPNAFATGRDPHHAAVAATTGLLAALDEEEVAGVMAHELAHVKNRDTLIMTMVATIAGAISVLANFGLFFRSDERSPWAGLLAVIVAPFAAMIVQMAISRTREYAADRGGAEISGNPRGLASALRKIARGAAAIPNPVSERSPAAAQLYIVPTRVSEMFSTHPATESRIAALEAMAGDFSAAPSGASGQMLPEPARSRAPSALDPLRRD